MFFRENEQSCQHLEVCGDRYTYMKYVSIKTQLTESKHCKSAGEFASPQHHQKLRRILSVQ